QSRSNSGKQQVIHRIRMRIGLQIEISDIRQRAKDARSRNKIILDNIIIVDGTIVIVERDNVSRRINDRIVDKIQMQRRIPGGLYTVVDKYRRLTLGRTVPARIGEDIVVYRRYTVTKVL